MVRAFCDALCGVTHYTVITAAFRYYVCMKSAVESLKRRRILLCVKSGQLVTQ